ncbi:MAG: 6-bladed beta-propeller [Gemmatimonadetes bacterium]|nr:6-bladed beta-propeller [Gemmatimonadota bacterium]
MADLRKLVCLFAWCGGLLGCGTERADAPPVFLRLSEVVLELGVLSGPESTTFGYIEDIAVLDDGSFFVLDSGESNLGWFDTDGRLIDEVDRAGDGPEEYRYPESVVVSGSYVHVLSARRITSYRVEADSLRFDRSMALPLIARDLCALDGRLYVSGLYDNRVLHELDSIGAVVRSFGEAGAPPDGYPEWAHASYSGRSADGTLLCLAGAHMLVVLPSSLPEVHAFADDGTEQWSVHLDDYSEQSVTVVGDGRSILHGVDPETGTSHRGEALFEADGYLFLQLSEASLSQHPDESVPETRVVSVRGGNVWHLSDKLPRIAVLRRGLSYGWQNLPFPQITVSVASTGAIQ